MAQPKKGLNTKIIVVVIVAIFAVSVVVFILAQHTSPSQTKKVRASPRQQVFTMTKPVCETKLHGTSTEVDDERFGPLEKTQICLPFDQHLINCNPDNLQGCWTKQSCIGVGGSFCPKELSAGASGDPSAVACFHPEVNPCLVRPVSDCRSDLQSCSTTADCESAGGFWNSDSGLCSPIQEAPQQKEPKANLVLEDVYFADPSTGSRLQTGMPDKEVQVKAIVKNNGAGDVKSLGGAQIANTVVVKKDGSKTAESSFPIDPSTLKSGSRSEQSVFADHTLKFTASGQYCIDISLDTQNSISEFVEGKAYGKKSCIIVGPKTLLQWTFAGVEGVVKDSSGNLDKNDGIVKGASQKPTAPGRGGRQAASFDGVSERIILSKPINLPNPDLTISFWARLPKSLPTSQQEIVYFHSIGDARIVSGPSGIGFIYKDKSLYTQAPLGGWMHVGLVAKKTGDDISLVTIYINGEPKSSDEFPLLVSQQMDMSLGGSGAPGFGSFKGLIDEIDVYNTAIPDDEIKGLYSPYQNTADLLLDWEMDGSQGNVLSDSSGYGNAGVLSGGKLVEGVDGSGILLDSPSSSAIGKGLDTSTPYLVATFFLKITSDLPASADYLFKLTPDTAGQSPPIAGVSLGGSKGIGLVWGGQEIYYQDAPLNEWVNVKVSFEKAPSGGSGTESLVLGSLFINGALKGQKTASLSRPETLYPVLAGIDKTKFVVDGLKIYSGTDLSSRVCSVDSQCEFGEKCRPDPGLCVKLPSCKKLVDNGPTKDKLDLAFIYDGKIDDAQFEQKITQLLDYNTVQGAYGLFSIEPFKSSKKKFNAWTLPSSGTILNKPDDISTSLSNVRSTNSAIFRECPSVDTAVVVSSQDFRSYTVKNTVFLSETYLKDKLASRVIHELGHAIFKLADEYTEAGLDNRPLKPNCARSVDEAIAFWGDNTQLDSSLVSKDQQGHISVAFNKGPVGFYKGCSYVPENIRPTEDSVMRSLESKNLDFGPVDTKYMVGLLSKYK